VAVRKDGSRTFGQTPNIRLLFIGSAPDETDSSTGIPFSGFAGRVLQSVIENVKHTMTYCMTYQVCCRTKDIAKLFKPDGKEYLSTDLDEATEFLLTPGTYAEVHNVGRLPTRKEIQLCSPHISQLVKSFKPRGIVLIGGETQLSETYNLPILRIFASTGIKSFHQYIEEQEYKLLLCRREANKLSHFIQEILS